MYLIIGMFIVAIPIMIIGCIAAWKEHQANKQG